MSELKTLLLAAPRRTLSVAESLTCGQLQALIGAESGASEFFMGGMTAYTLEQKVRHLGVDRAEADAVNSVSARVAEQMARGACVLFGTDVAASTTGYAEPYPSAGVSEPYAWWGLAMRAGADFAVCSGRLSLSGLGRVAAQQRVAQATLDALTSWLRAQSAARTP